MDVYLLTIISALVVAVGEVLQQRSAAQAPPEHNLSIRLLLWLVRRPRWLAGLLASTAGNGIFVTAVGRGNVALNKPASGQVPEVRWLIGGGSVVAVALVLAVLARHMPPVVKAAVLGVGGGLLFGLQASLTQSALHDIGRAGLIAMMMTWNGYAVAARSQRLR